MMRPMADELESLQTELAQLRDENARLEAEVNRLTTALAEARMGEAQPSEAGRREATAQETGGRAYYVA